MKNNLQRAFHFEKLEIREATQDQPAKLVGYAARFMQMSEDMGGWRERILPGAFKRSLTDMPSVVALYGHDWGRILARTDNGSLLIYEDSHGLRVEITLPNTTLGKDAQEEVRAGLIEGMSFGFNIVSSTTIDIAGELVQELRDVDLYEVSLVSLPAYKSTSIALRSKPVLPEAPQAEEKFGLNNEKIQRQAEAELSLGA